MKQVSPEVYLIAKTQIQPEAVDRWLAAKGVSETATQRILDANKTSAERLVECAGRRCYMSFEPGLNPNVTKIREEISTYIENILSSGHGSVLEHVKFTFAIENVSRVFTGEMNRHRAGVAISEGSMRYIRFDSIPFWIPTCLQENPKDDQKLAAKKAASRRVITETLDAIELGYMRLQETWKDELAPQSTFHLKKQLTSMMRRIIPMGVATGGIWSLNVRALRHVCTIRTSAAAEEEIALVSGKILEIMMREEPNLFGDFKMTGGYWAPRYVKV